MQERRLPLTNHPVPKPDLSDPKSISTPFTIISKKRDMILVQKSKILEDLTEKQKLQSIRFRSRLSSLRSVLLESSTSLLLCYIPLILNSFIKWDLIYPFLIHLLIFLLSQIGLLFIDIRDLKKYAICYNRSLPKDYQVKMKLKFTAVRAIKNILLGLNVSVILIQVGKDKIDRFVLPAEIIIVLYFVIIIYFVINTGEVMKFMVKPF